ncbi:hypothetical protein GCM10028801_17260 [Nocardioides maradonensis]
MARSPLDDVLASAARLQTLVPDAVLVGGSAAAYHAHHRLSFDHDHVLADLRDRFDVVLEALESDPEFVFNRATPGKIILGSLGEIEVGVRQLIRERPVEFEEVSVTDGATVRVPTLEETLRIKAYLIVKRNQVRDHLDVAALADTMGIDAAADTLADIDDYYTDPAKSGEPVRDQLTRQLGLPRPKDTRTIDELPRYKGLVPRWQDWADVTHQLQALAAAMIERS